MAAGEALLSRLTIAYRLTSVRAAESCGSCGTGFFEASLERGLERHIDFIGSDAGSTDGGPRFLAGERA